MLPRLRWKFIGAQTFAPDSTSGVPNGLNGLYTLLSSTTYYDGSARTPGTGQAWSTNREGTGASTVAVWGAPPSGSPIAAANIRYIVGGTSGAGPATMLRDAFTANAYFQSMARDAGAYTTWTAANPFTSGTFCGYVRATAAASTYVYQRWLAWECDEGLIATLQRDGSGSLGNTNAFFWGAVIDPTASGDGIAESNGRLYSFSGSSDLPTSIGNNTADQLDGWLRQHNNSSGDNYHYMMFPGSGSISSTTMWRASARMNYVTTVSSLLSQPAGSYVDWLNRMHFQPLIMEWLGGGTGSPRNTSWGRLREIGMGPLGVVGAVQRSGQADAAYCVAFNAPSTDSNFTEAFWLMA